MLRPDDVPFLSSSTLLAAEKVLYDTSRDPSLLDLIQRELANRRVNALLFDDDDGGEESEQTAPIPPATSKPTTGSTVQTETTGGPPPRAPLSNGKPAKPALLSPSPHPPVQFTSFVTTQSNNNSKGFKARAREAARSRKAKAMEQSEEHKLLVAEKQREERRRAIVQRMEERRQRRQQAEEARERKRQREQQRRVERARELEEEMERAAELAKAEAESNGMTHEEAVASAAAAAAALVEQASSCDIGDFDSDCDVTIASSAGSSTGEHGAAASDDSAGSVCVGSSIGEEGAGGDLDSDASGCSDSESGSNDRLGARDLSKSESSNAQDSDSSVHGDEADIGGEETQANLQESPQKSCSPLSPSSDDVGGSPDEVASDSSSIPVANDEEDILATHAETLDQYHPETPRSPTPMASPPSPPPSSPSVQERTFVSIYPHFWSLFTAFSQNASASPLTPVANRDKKNKARPTEAIDALLKHQIRINNEFLEAMEDYLEFQDTSGGVLSQPPPACLSSDRFVLINSGRTDVASLISDVLTTGNDCDEEGQGSWHEMPVDVGPGSSFNLLWTWRQPQVDVQSLLLCQKINRFRGTRCLTRKDLLKKSIQKSSASTSRSNVSRTDLQGIMPLTFVLPQEYNAFVAAFSAIQRIPGASQSNLWISKPIGMSRGRGIQVVNDIGDVSYSQPIVMQKYLMNPLLFRSYKFDLRLYVLVTAFSGLEAFIYSEGLARFASKPFLASPDSIYDEQIHLTNSSIQKEYQFGSDHPVRMAGAAGGDNKVRLTWLLRRLEGIGQGGIDTKLLWDQIKELCRKTLQVVDGSIPAQPNSFEIFGFDVIISDDLKPLLIEVNACPALARDSALDADVKEDLIRDTIALVDPPTIDRMALSRICKERLGGQSGRNLEEDLRAIFMGRLPRQTGEMPRDLGGYEILVMPESIK